MAGSQLAGDSPIVFNALHNSDWYDAHLEGQCVNERGSKVEKYVPWGRISPEDAVSCYSFRLRLSDFCAYSQWR